jgi:hypothetical protein
VRLNETIGIRVELLRILATKRRSVFRYSERLKSIRFSLFSRFLGFSLQLVSLRSQSVHVHGTVVRGHIDFSVSHNGNVEFIVQEENIPLVAVP